MEIMTIIENTQSSANDGSIISDNIGNIAEGISEYAAWVGAYETRSVRRDLTTLLKYDTLNKKQIEILLEAKSLLAANLLDEDVPELAKALEKASKIASKLGA
jgi:hypothetical protein